LKKCCGTLNGKDSEMIRMSDECIFCKIVKKDLPSHTLYEDDEILVFLDLYPASKGHTLYIPKEHVSTLYDMSENNMRFLKKLPMIAKKLRDAVNSTGLNVLQSNGKDAGQVIEHIHFHLIPRYPDDQLMTLVPKAQLSDEEAKPIVENFQK
jgi:histidine triad (HIT) family protein